jgi:hypothetical protein
MLLGLLIVIGSLAFGPVASAAPPPAPFVLAQGNVDGATVVGAATPSDDAAWSSARGH